MKVKYNKITAIPMYGGFTYLVCCFNTPTKWCVRQRFTDLGLCISETKYYKHTPKSDIFEL